MAIQAATYMLCLMKNTALHYFGQIVIAPMSFVHKRKSVQFYCSFGYFFTIIDQPVKHSIDVIHNIS